MNRTLLRSIIVTALALCLLFVAVSSAFAEFVVANQKVRRSGTLTWRDGPLYVTAGQTVDFNCAAGGGSGYGYSCAWKSCVSHTTHSIASETWYKATTSSAHYIPAIGYYRLGTHAAQFTVINAWGTAYNRDSIVVQ